MHALASRALPSPGTCWATAKAPERARYHRAYQLPCESASVGEAPGQLSLEVESLCEAASIACHSTPQPPPPNFTGWWLLLVCLLIRLYRLRMDFLQCRPVCGRQAASLCCEAGQGDGGVVCWCVHQQIDFAPRVHLGAGANASAKKGLVSPSRVKAWRFSKEQRERASPNERKPSSVQVLSTNVSSAVSALSLSSLNPSKLRTIAQLFEVLLLLRLCCKS